VSTIPFTVIPPVLIEMTVPVVALELAHTRPARPPTGVRVGVGIRRIERMAAVTVSLARIGVAPVTYPVPLVSGAAIPAEVTNTVVRPVIVPVAAFQPIGAWADERGQHQPMYQDHPLTSQANLSSRIQTPLSPVAPYPATAGHLVTREVGDRTPNLRRFATAIHESDSRAYIRHFPGGVADFVHQIIQDIHSI
jgi:hypothetical protein